jgi:hypothetical protein
MTALNSFHNDLKTVKELVYDQANLSFTNLNWNTESREYGACSFELDNKKIQHRVSKITPTKIGQFVTIWKRNQDGITQPFDDSDEIDFIIITSRSGDKLGQFIFPKKILADREIISQNGKSGKRGIRVYPPWDVPKSKQAEKTQSWQINFFLSIKPDGSTDLGLAMKLFNPNY